MGAFLVTYPRDQIKSILIIFVFLRVTFIPAAVLNRILVPYAVVQRGSDAATENGGVAYAAHVAGAVFGALTARLFEDADRVSAQL